MIKSEQIDSSFDGFSESTSKYLEIPEVRDLWNTVMDSIENIREILTEAVENTYVAMEPEIEDFVWEFDADIESNVRTFYKVQKKYMNYLDEKMIQEFIVEILEQIRPILKQVKILQNKMKDGSIS